MRQPPPSIKPETNNPGIVAVPIQRVHDGHSAGHADYVAVEEPLEIRLGFDSPAPTAPVGDRAPRSISVTMRTPGHDIELAAGFLLSEGIIAGGERIHAVRPCTGADGSLIQNVIRVELKAGVSVDLGRLERHFYTSSSCGVCGKSSIAAVRTARQTSAGEISQPWAVSAALINRLPEMLRQSQAVFDRTGGLHASALFTTDGTLIAVREDIGRHNALDKLIGSELLAGHLPLSQRLLMLSGRASFELIQKAMMAGIPLVAAVRASSSLAVEFARQQNMTLLGFVREDRFNIYCGPDRVCFIEPASP